MSIGHSANVTEVESAVSAIERLSVGRLSRSIFTSGARWGITLVLTAIVFPLMLSRLGQAGFGRWAVLTTPTSMASVFDIGVLQAVVALAGPVIGRLGHSDSAAEHGELLAEFRSFVSTGFLIAACSAILILIAGLTLAPTIVNNLIGQVATVSDVFLLRASVLNLACTVLAAGLLAPIEACGRIDISATVWGVLSVLNSVGICVALAFSPSQWSLGIVVGVVGFLTALIPAVLLWWLGLGGALLAMPNAGLRVKKVLRVGVGVGGAGALGALVDPAIKWVLTPVVGLPSIAGYELAMRVVNIVAGFFRALAYPLASYFARSAHSTGERLRASLAIGRMGAILSTVALPALAALAVLGPQLNELWLASSAPAGFAISLAILSVGSMISMVAVPAYLGLTGAGSSRTLLWVQSVTIITAIVVPVMYRFYAAPSAVTPSLAMALAMSFGACVTLFGWRSVGNAGVRQQLASSRTGVLGALIVVGIGAVGVWSGAASTVTVLIVCVTVVVFFFATGGVRTIASAHPFSAKGRTDGEAND